MKHFRTGIVLLLGIALIALGCGSDDDGGGSNAPTMSADEQYQLMSSFLGDVDATLAPAMLDLALLSLGTGFLDGIDDDDLMDFDFSDFFLTGMRFSGMDKSVKNAIPRLSASAQPDYRLSERIASALEKTDADADSVAISYDVERGWWFVYASFDIDTLVEGMAMDISMTMSDSMRFEDASGQPMLEPSSQTNRFRHGLNVAVNFGLVGGFSEEGVVTDFDVSLDLGVSGDADAAGLNAATTTVTSSTAFGIHDMDVDIFMNSPDIDPIDMDINGDLDMNASVAGLQFPTPTTPGAEDPCPTDGLLSAGADIDMNVTANSQQQRALGSWTIAVDITGPGTADVDMTSGDFQVGADNVDICTDGF